MNHRSDIDAILVQMPLPRHIDSRRVLEAVAPDKDADGFHPLNVGHLVAGRPAPRACTPAGIMEMLKYYRIPIDGRTRGGGGPQRHRGQADGADAAGRERHRDHLPFAHGQTGGGMPRADILVAAIGKPALVTADFIAPGATVIDVGTNRITESPQKPSGSGRRTSSQRTGQRLGGRRASGGRRRVAAAYSPVPGGVGPLTIAMLMTNTVVWRSGTKRA